jgi:hypothetical protein
MLLILMSVELRLPKLPAELSSELMFDIVLSVLIVLALLTVESIVSIVADARP